MKFAISAQIFAIFLTTANFSGLNWQSYYRDTEKFRQQKNLFYAIFVFFWLTKILSNYTRSSSQ